MMTDTSDDARNEDNSPQSSPGVDVHDSEEVELKKQKGFNARNLNTSNYSKLI